MNATEEWLRYIESQVLKQKYNIKDYSDNKQEIPREEDEN